MKIFNETSFLFQPTLAVQSHYALMYELVAYIEKCRTEGQIHQMTGNDNLKTKLHYIEMKMYDVICSMKIALRGEGASTNHTISREVISSTFLGLNKTLVNETYRAYVVMNDSEGVMNYLKEVFSTIQTGTSHTA